VATHLNQRQKQLSLTGVKWEKYSDPVVWPNKPEEEQSHLYLAISTFLFTTSHGTLSAEVVTSSPIIMFFHVDL